MKEQLKQLASDLKAAGYKSAALASGRGDDLMDLLAVPAQLLGKDRNFAALPLIKKAGVKFDELTVFGDTLIFRNVRPDQSRPAGTAKHETPGAD